MSVPDKYRMYQLRMAEREAITAIETLRASLNLGNSVLVRLQGLHEALVEAQGIVPPDTGSEAVTEPQDASEDEWDESMIPTMGQKSTIRDAALRSSE